MQGRDASDRTRQPPPGEANTGFWFEGVWWPRGTQEGLSRRIVRGGWFIHLEKQLYLRTCLGATGRVYDVADASGRLLAPASCTKMCGIDSVRLERHDSVLAG